MWERESIERTSGKFPFQFLRQWKMKLAYWQVLCLWNGTDFHYHFLLIWWHQKARKKPIKSFMCSSEMSRNSITALESPHSFYGEKVSGRRFKYFKGVVPSFSGFLSRCVVSQRFLSVIHWEQTNSNYYEIRRSPTRTRCISYQICFDSQLWSCNCVCVRTLSTIK